MDTRRDRPHYWERAFPPDGRPGHELAALRRGVGQEPGAAPALWPYYTTLNAEGHVSDRLRAEHVALTLYGVHQQSTRKPVHRAGVGLGAALAVLRRSDSASSDGVDRRFSAAATSTSFAEIGAHLRGLVTRLRGVETGLDYTRLYRDLVAWQRPDGVARVRRSWGSQYFTAVEQDARSGTDLEETA